MATKNIQNLLRDGRVDKDATKDIYHLDESKAPDIVQEIKYGDVLLGDGHIYVLIAQDGTKEVVIGNSSDTYDSAFKMNSGDDSGGGSGGVQSVTGDGVGGSSDHVTISFPTPEDIGAVTTEELEEKSPELGLNDFLVGGENGNEGRGLSPNDIGYISGTGLRLVSILNGEFTNPYAATSAPLNTTIVVRTSTGQGKFSPSVNDDEAVVQSQFQSGLESKVDKVTGEGLTPEKFTSDEKSKLAGLENVHYKGWFTSLSSLQSAYPSPEEGSHALVDDAAGALVYIWKTDVEPPQWEAKVGESTEITAAQVKTYYESNPDTNAFTDAEKSKLASITSAFTSSLKTAYDNVVTWITTNGQLLLDHLTNTSNPHNVTAVQVGLGDIDERFSSKADLVGGKIPQEQLPQTTGESSLIAQVTATSTTQYIIADLPADAPNLLRFELYIPDTIAPSYISMRFNGINSGIYKHVLQNVNNASYSMTRNYSQNQLRVMASSSGAVVGRYNVRIEGTISNVAGQIKIANGTSFLAGNSPSAAPDINNFFGSAHEQGLTDGKITQLLFVAMNSSGTGRIASGSVLKIYGI